MLHRGLRLCTLSSPPAKPTISRKGLGWKMFSAECRNTNWAKRTSRIFSLGTGHLPNAKVTQTDIKLTQKRMQLTPHPCQLHLTLSICTSSDAYRCFCFLFSADVFHLFTEFFWKIGIFALWKICILNFLLAFSLLHFYLPVARKELIASTFCALMTSTAPGLTELMSMRSPHHHK